MAKKSDAKDTDVKTNSSPESQPRRLRSEGSTGARLTAVEEANDRIEFLLAQLLMAEEAAKLELVKSVEQAEREQERPIVLDPVSDPDLEPMHEFGAMTDMEPAEDGDTSAEGAPKAEEELSAPNDVDEASPSDAEQAEPETEEDASDVTTAPETDEDTIDESDSEAEEEELSVPGDVDEANPSDVEQAKPETDESASDETASGSGEELPAFDDVDEPVSLDEEQEAPQKEKESTIRLKREALIPELDVPEVETPEQASEVSSRAESSEAGDGKNTSSHRRAPKVAVLANKEHGARLEVGMSVMDDATSGRTRELQGRRKRMEQREGFFGSIGAFVVRVLHLDS